MDAELPEELCTICHLPKSQHSVRRHEFTSDGSNSLRSRDDRSDDSASSRPTSDQGRVRNAMMGDPVLRLILIRQGIISVVDLNQVEQELEAAGYATATSVGEPRDR